MADYPDNDEWDEDFARDLVGARVLIGLTYLRKNGDLDQQVQMFGVVQSATREDGITIALEGSRAGQFYQLPPTVLGWEPAPPGEYRLRSTGEVVIDPDYTTSWTITKNDN